MTRPEKNLTLRQRVVMRKLSLADGTATAKELNSNYVEIEPLIRRGFVRVSNIAGTAVYILTESGHAWCQSTNPQE